MSFLHFLWLFIVNVSAHVGSDDNLWKSFLSFYMNFEAQTLISRLVRKAFPCWAILQGHFKCLEYTFYTPLLTLVLNPVWVQPCSLSYSGSRGLHKICILKPAWQLSPRLKKKKTRVLLFKLWWLKKPFKTRIRE